MSNRKKGLAKDIVRGADTFAQTLRMLFFSLAAAALVSLIVTIIAWYYIWSHTASEEERGWAWSLIKAETIQTAGMGNLYTIALPPQKGKPVSIKPRRLLQDPRVTALEVRLIKKAAAGWQQTKAVGAITFCLLIIAAFLRGIKLRADDQIRGGSIVSAKNLAKELRRRKKAGDLTIGEIPLPKNAEVQHILITGAPGTGKSVLISQLLDRIRDRGDRAIVYDRSGDFVANYYDTKRGDVILNPQDARCPCWTPWQEIHGIGSYKKISSTIIPEQKEGGDPFWVDSARSLLSAALMRIKSHNVNELLDYTLTAPLSELAEVIKGTVAGAIIGDEENAKMALSIKSTMITRLECLFLLPKQGLDKKEFSVRNWVRDDTQKSWLFLTSKADQHDAIRPLLTTWLDSAISSILSLPPSKSRRIWLILDELPSLQKVPSLQTALAEGRKYGLSGLLGIQSVAQLREIYGKDGAEALLGQPSTQIHLRATDPDTAEWISKALYEKDVYETKEDLSYSAADAKDGVRLSDQRQTRKLVLPTEIMSQPDLHAYVRLSGDLPIAQTKLAIKQRDAISESYIAADESKMVGAELMGIEPKKMEVDGADEADDKDPASNTDIEVTSQNMSQKINKEVPESKADEEEDQKQDSTSEEPPASKVDGEEIITF